MRGHNRQDFELAAVEFMEKAGWGLSCLHGVHQNQIIEAHNVIQKRQPHFRGFLNLNPVRVGEVFSDFARDIQSHRVVAQNVVAQAEHQNPFLPARRFPRRHLRRRCFHDSIMFLNSYF